MNEKVEKLKGKLIVSCQALPHEPLHSSFIMGRMALAAKEGGAYGIRANTKEDIRDQEIAKWTQVGANLITYFNNEKQDQTNQLIEAINTLIGRMDNLEAATSELMNHVYCDTPCENEAPEWPDEEVFDVEAQDVIEVE